MTKGMMVALAVCMPILGSCSDIATDGPQPLALEFTASLESTTVGQSVAFSFSATGGWLIGLTLDYGDGTTESVPGHGSHALNGTREHAWEVAGSYRVRASLEDGTLGSLTDEVTIEVLVP